MSRTGNPRRRFSTVDGLRLFAAVLAIVAPACDPNAPTAQARERVILVTIDTLRWDTFEGSGNQASALPETLAFARRGAIFSRAYAASNVTQPTHASLFTGLHPWEHGVTRNGQLLDFELETVAETFRDAGFSTSAIVASFALDSDFGFDQGFDAYEAIFGRELATLRQWEGRRVPQGLFYELADRVVEHALARLSAAEGERQFFWFHFFDTHDPYGDTVTDEADLGLPELYAAAASKRDVPATLARARHLYRADAGALDRALARLWQRIDAEPSIVTHVVFTADHGESFGEGGALGHGDALTAWELHVPLFVVSPRVDPGERDDVVGSVDIPATLMGLADIPHAYPGRSLLAVGDSDARVWGMSSTAPDKRGRDGRYFAVVDGTIYAGAADGVLFEDRAGLAAPEAIDEQLRKAFAIFDGARGRGVSLTDPETRAALEALGYAVPESVTEEP